MIDHVVIIKFSQETPNETLVEACTKFKALKGIIPGIVDAQAGINFSKNNQGYQVMLTARFEDLAALEAYGPHPAHREVADFIRENGREDSIVMDIEV